MKKMPKTPMAFATGVFVTVLLFLSTTLLGDSGDSLSQKLEDVLSDLDHFLYGETSVAAGPAEGTMTVDIIDVGQGESILITTAEKVVLIDAGENNKGKIVIDHLKKRGVERIDLAIGTHAHSDHIGGMDTVMSQIPVGEFWMGAMPDSLVPSTKTYLDVLEMLDVNRIPLKEPDLGTQFDLGSGGVLTVLGPAGESSNLNNCSLVCRVDFGETSFLFSGDAEKEEEQAILETKANLDVDVMTMGHHGSSTSSSKAYFQAASPDYAAISCGADNKYGHPHKETIQKLKNSDTLYRRTDINGTITFTTDGKKIDLSTER